ncbi:MAG: LysM peptidoglycan-binding domain-containing protein [Acidobacteriota bacterium]
MTPTTTDTRPPQPFLGPKSPTALFLAVLALGLLACAPGGPPPVSQPPVEAAPAVPPEVARAKALAEQAEALCQRAEEPDLSDEESRRLLQAMDALFDEALDEPPAVLSDPRLQGTLNRMADLALQLDLDANAAPPEAPPEEESPKDTLLKEATFLSPADLQATLAQVEASLKEVSVGLEVPASDPAVLAYVNLYQTRLRKWFASALERGAPYVPRMQEIFRDEGVPPSLVYLAIVESAFHPGAVSRARAVGMWQFVAGTAQRYGLTVDFWEDQRLDPELSARASARYLKDLRQMLGNWSLALASYNCGEAKVLRYQQRKPSATFQELCKARVFRRETREYVPAIYAAILVASNPAAYGFASPEADPPEPTATVPLTEATDLRVLARCAQVPVEELQKLNPSLKRLVTPPREYLLRIPAQNYDAFRAAFEAVPPEERLAVAIHTVQKGENLASIARHYKTSAEAIRLANLLKSRRVSPGQSLVVPLGPAASDPSLYAERRPTPSRAARVYRVKAGETLASVSRATGISVERLRELNNLATDRLKPGQRLVLAEEGRAPRRDSTHPSPATGGPRVHHIQAGDTLWDLARRYGTTVEKICRANRISPGKRLNLGDTLIIP